MERRAAWQTGGAHCAIIDQNCDPRRTGPCKAYQYATGVMALLSSNRHGACLNRTVFVQEILMPVRKVSHRTVIVGGGAGGLQLAARLGRRYGPDSVTLLDTAPFHIWKPSLHEVAAGTLDIHQEG